MKTGTFQNRRKNAWLLTLLLLALALPSGAAWRCVNGAACPMPCAAAQMRTPAAFRTPAAMPACATCRAAKPADRGMRAGANCATTRCVLQIQTRPDAALTEKTVFFFPALALPPPAPRYAAAAPKTMALAFAPLLIFSPPRLGRAHPGRAPPISL